MGEGPYATEGDLGHTGLIEPAPWDSGWDTGPRQVDDADVQEGVARRLRARLDRQLELLGRMADDPLRGEPAQLPELTALTRRMRRDTDSMLLLLGREPGGDGDRPQPLRVVLDDAVAAAEAPHRVDALPGPPATVQPAAATELRHLVAELLDHAAAAYPGSRIEVGAHADGSAGTTLRVRATDPDGLDSDRFDSGGFGPSRFDPDGPDARRTLDAAERLARRSRNGITLRREFGAGLVATITAPRWAITPDAPPRVDEPAGVGEPPRGADWDDAVRDEVDESPETGPIPLVPAPSALAPLAARPLSPLTALTGGRPDPPEPDPFADEPRSPWADPPFAPPAAEQQPSPVPRDTLAPLWPDRVSDLLDTHRNGTDGDDGHGGGGNGHRPDEGGWEPPPSRFPPEDESAIVTPPAGFPTVAPVDELFGPLTDIPFDDASDSMSTPIFEAIASAWFRDDEATPDQAWEPSATDVEWRAAADRANHVEAAPLTANGLPRRQPGNHLVPPRAAAIALEKPAERVPDRVRERLSGYQRGLNEGRHRAETQPVESD